MNGNPALIELENCFLRAHRVTGFGSESLRSLFRIGSTKHKSKTWVCYTGGNCSRSSSPSLRRISQSRLYCLYRALPRPRQHGTADNKPLDPVQLNQQSKRTLQRTSPRLISGRQMQSLPRLMPPTSRFQSRSSSLNAYSV